MSIKAGTIYRTPWDPYGLFRVTAIVGDQAIGRYVGDHPVARDGDKGAFFVGELECREASVTEWQAALDSAAMHAQLAELQAENERMIEWIGRSYVLSDYQSADHMRDEIAMLRKQVAALSSEAPVQDDAPTTQEAISDE